MANIEIRTVPVPHLKLAEQIENQGRKITWLAGELNIEPATFTRKLHQSQKADQASFKYTFSANEKIRLSEILQVPVDVLFPETRLQDGVAC